MPTKKSESLVLVSKQNGFVIIPAATPLTRLNYFDGKFLRASDLKAEQDYLRQLVRKSNQAGGAGVAHGFDLALSGGDRLEIGVGLAIDAEGRVLLLPQATSIGVQELIDKSRDLQRLFGKTNVLRAGTFETCEVATDTPVTPQQPGNLYVIVISAAEALCGEEDVYGKLCEEACATSTDRPFAVEGVIVRAIPLVLKTPLPTSKAVPPTQIHWRSRVASAYFNDERNVIASLISGEGLKQATWCMGADAAADGGVPIGVIARAGATTIFLDPWIVRRELIDTPAKRYWQWRMMMRPWDVFMAQVLQFQCQLRGLYQKLPAPGTQVDPCAGAGDVIKEAATAISEIKKFYEVTADRLTDLNRAVIPFEGGINRLSVLNLKLETVYKALSALPRERWLINGGIVELPSAGYLPVVPGVETTINQQVRRMMGEGVDLRFCVVRPDYVAHALEEAQHMERISLAEGLDDPKRKPEVDILVPNGEILEQRRLSPGRGFDASVNLSDVLFSETTNLSARFDRTKVQTHNFRGAARTERLPSGGGAVYLSCEFEANVLQGVSLLDRSAVIKPAPADVLVTGADSLRAALDVKIAPAQVRIGLWTNLTCERNVFDLKLGDKTNFNARAIVATTATAERRLDVDLNGALEITEEATTSGTAKRVKGHIENARLSFIRPTAEPVAKPIFVDLDATITLTAGSAIEILLEHPSVAFVLTANWEKQPMEVKATISHRRKNAAGQTEDTPLAIAALKENPDVLSDKNANHIRALASLDIVAAALKAPNFASANARLLFPPPPKPTDELLVRGVMDWVLFHRRRNKVCSIDVPAPPPPPPPVKTVCHSVYRAVDTAALTLASSLIVAAKTAAELNAAIVKAKLTPLGDVQFKEGTADVADNPSLQSVVEKWKTAGDGVAFHAVIVCPQPTAQEEQLRKEQLTKIRAAIGTVPGIAGPGTRLTTAPLPTNCPVFSIIAVRDVEVVPVTHTVFRAATAPQFEDAVKTIQTMTGGNIQQVILKDQLLNLGDVEFEEHTSNVFGDGKSIEAVAKAWKDNGAGTISKVAVVHPVAQQGEKSHADQAKTIAQKTGGAAIADSQLQVVTVSAGVTMPTAAPAFSILLPEALQRTARILYQTDSNSAGERFFTATQPAVLTVQFNADGSLTAALSAAVLADIRRAFPNRVQRVELATGQTPADALAGKRLDAIFAGLASVLLTGATKQVVALKPTEQIHRDLGGGAQADDVIFLSMELT